MYAPPQRETPLWLLFGMLALTSSVTGVVVFGYVIGIHASYGPVESVAAALGWIAGVSLCGLGWILASILNGFCNVRSGLALAGILAMVAQLAAGPMPWFALIPTALLHLGGLVLLLLSKQEIQLPPST